MRVHILSVTCLTYVNTNDSALFTKYVYIYKELDSSFSLLSMLTVPIYRKVETDIQLKTRTTKLKDRQLNINIELSCTYKSVTKMDV